MIDAIDLAIDALEEFAETGGGRDECAAAIAKLSELRKGLIQPAKTDGPHDPNMDGPNLEAERLTRIARYIEEQFGGKRSIGFYLVVVAFDTPDSPGNYISNIDRDDVIEVMKRRIARLEQMKTEPKPGRA